MLHTVSVLSSNSCFKTQLWYKLKLPISIEVKVVGLVYLILSII